MTAYDVFFTILGVIAVGGATLAVTTKHVTHAALWLVVSLTAVSGCYLVLGAEIVALANLLVYVGAIVVLVLVAMMLTRSPIGRSPDQDAPLVRRVVAFVVAVATAALLGSVLLFSWGTSHVRLKQMRAARMSHQLFDDWVWPFEMLSLLLLVAAVAAFAMLRLRIRDGASSGEPTGDLPGALAGDGHQDDDITEEVDTSAVAQRDGAMKNPSAEGNARSGGATARRPKGGRR